MTWTPHILYEDNHYIAISKPAGLSVQAEYEEEEAVIPILQDFIGKRDKKPGKAFIGVLHRLDKLVTGVLVLAKTSKGQERFNELLKNKSVKKYYAALTEKVKVPMEGKLVHYFSRKGEELRMHVSSTQKSPQDQEARLNYKIIAVSGDSQCWAIELITGRRHQIRAQLAYLHAPILGDKRYGSKVTLEDGIGLHCIYMSFIHPIKKTKVVIKDNPNHKHNLWQPYRQKLIEWMSEM